MAIKTRRGVFINLKDSDILFTHNDKVYKFSSQKKREIFMKRCADAIILLKKLQGKIFRYTENTKDYNLNGLIEGVYDKIYNTMDYK